MARILIGTSGWHYESWRGPFFPKGLLLKDQLQFYGSQFATTELNGVFYRTPTPAAVKGWRQQTGGDFVFAWKASKFITHWKRLSEKSDAVRLEAFFEGAASETPLQLRASPPARKPLRAAPCR
jgi:uncharacterized protein YecE (DUF72 family)